MQVIPGDQHGHRGARGGSYRGSSVPPPPAARSQRQEDAQRSMDAPCLHPLNGIFACKALNLVDIGPVPYATASLTWTSTVIHL